MQDLTILEASTADIHGERSPRVSVGIPTFNRPDGLRRTLRFICGQTYRNLEILVSDNASAGSETEEVVAEFAGLDKRITYFRQPTNLGAIANFRFVLSKASGDYFMWAADDDEWEESFIETCVLLASPSCSVMTKFDTFFRTRNFVEENPIPRLSPEAPVFQNVASYFALMQPSLFYALHPRASLRFFLEGPYFDFHDCYVVLRIILESNYRTIDRVLYRIGVDVPEYETKYADPVRKRLRYWPFFSQSCLAIIGCSRLSLLERVRLLGKLTWTVLGLRRHLRRSSRAKAS